MRWAQGQAARLGVAFTGSPENIEAMIRNGRFEDGDLFLDYGVKGNQLQRPGLDALFRVARTDLGVTHIFIPRRDRFARPDDPADAMQMENTLREAGLTLVFMNKTLPPLGRGKRDLGESIVAMVDYDHAGQERRTLAQKIIYAQLKLASMGYSTGGRPPFGFRRWLVSMEGAVVRQLSEGEYVKMAGHHVVWLPGPEGEIALIRRILTMLETTPASRVARKLTEEGVPTSDARRRPPAHRRRRQASHQRRMAAGVHRRHRPQPAAAGRHGVWPAVDGRGCASPRTGRVSWRKPIISRTAGLGSWSTRRTHEFRPRRNSTLLRSLTNKSVCWKSSI